MRAGEEVALTGTVKAATTRTTKAGNLFVRATVDCGDDGEVVAVWWTAAMAPSMGERVSFNGRVREYQGKLEVHVDDTRAERPVPNDPLARVLGYYIDCVESEATENLLARADSGSVLTLSSGTAPAFSSEPSVVGADRQSRQWCVTRRGTIGETLLSGYPVVVGHQPGESALSVTPLFMTEVSLSEEGGEFRIERLTDSFDVNPSALSLLGLTHEERDECLATLDASVEFESAADRVDRLRVGVEIVLAAADRTMSDPLDPYALQPFTRGAPGLYNSAVVLATAGGTTYTRRLLEDLEVILARPEVLRSGPLGVLFGAQAAEKMPLPSAHPIVVPSTLRQDQAVSAAMSTPFTVVTGPPGTGKSQVLVNVVAAALAAGETVLFASKNNKAVDVVCERMRDVSANANVLRAGNAGHRGALAQSIGTALGRTVTGDCVAAATRQREIGQSVDSLFARLAERQKLELEADRLNRVLETKLRELPPEANLDFDRPTMDARVGRVSETLNAFADRLPLLRRRKRWAVHKARIEAARVAASELHEFLKQNNLGAFDVESHLPVAKPTRSYGPASALRSVHQLIATVHEASESRTTRDAIRKRIDTEFQIWSIEDALAELAPARLEAGRQLIDVLWAERIRANPEAANHARLLQGDIQAAADGGTGAASARSTVPRVLQALPVWGVTNLSAGTNFPLERGMFDLVVIDEASQCDVASAIPLLYRGKRALIIGDDRQLIHITQLGSARNRAIAKRWQVNDTALKTFDYRTRSLFTLATHRLGEPLMLDLHFRSRPAIIDFSNRHFYGGRLEICTAPIRTSGAPTIRWIDVEGVAERGRNGRSWRNRAEAQLVVSTLRRLLDELGHSGRDIGIVAPFRAQVEEIRLLADEVLGSRVSDVLIETAHRFQGDERAVMIFSPVLSANLSTGTTRFAADPNLLNVALTRARDRLFVTGSRSACLRSETSLAAFAEYVIRLEASAFDSPLELALFDELLRRGVASEPGRTVAGYRMDLAVEFDGHRVDVECDGAAFHTIAAADAARDAAIQLQGWTVMRFSGRELSRDVRACADRICAAIGA